MQLFIKIDYVKNRVNLTEKHFKLYSLTLIKQLVSTDGSRPSFGSKATLVLQNLSCTMKVAIFLCFVGLQLPNVENHWLKRISHNYPFT